MPDEATTPQFTLRADDPAAPFALLAYASAAANKGADGEYIAKIKALASAMYLWQDTHGILPPGHSQIPIENISKLRFGTTPRTFDKEATNG